MIVSGAGTGLGQSLLQRFQSGGYKAVGFVRSMPDPTTGLDIRQLDLTHENIAAEKISELITTYGPPKVVIHNTAQLVIQPFAETTLDDFEQCWQSMVKTAIVVAQSTLQPMVRGGGGAFIVSGATASIRGGAKFSAFASAKFALRGLTQSLAREYQPAGIHVIHTILDGIIDTERSRSLHALDPSKMMNPDDIAEVYWQCAHQSQTTWSHEIDLRPQTESF